MKKVWIIGVGVLALSLITACSAPETSEKNAPGPSTLGDLTQITELASAFDKSDQEHRMVLLLSPT